MVELVVSLVLVGIVAVVALPRFVGRNGFDTRAYHDLAIAAFQYAQQQAVAQRRLAVNRGQVRINPCSCHNRIKLPGGYASRKAAATTVAQSGAGRVGMTKMLPRRRFYLRAFNGGFTLVELIVIMMLVGILAVAAIPRFVDRSAFDATGFSDQTKAALGFAQKSAIAQRHNVCASIAGNTLTLTQAMAPGVATACTAALNNPSTGQPYAIAAPAGVTLAASASPFQFDGLGRPNLAASVTVTVAVPGDASLTRTITVETETGYVR